MIKITFPDGSVREYESGITGFQVAQSISQRLADDVLACSINDEVCDVNTKITEDATIMLHKWDDAEGKRAFWHTSAHLLAEALQELYPGIQFGIGPAIENGFYYDVDSGDTVIKEESLAAIEKKMAELAAKKSELVRAEISKEDALKFFGDKGQEYKCELISELEDGTITTYTQGAFTDLCKGPHIPSTAPIKAIKLLSVAGAYWRGKEDRKQLTRIYGVSFPKKKMLDEYILGRQNLVATFVLVDSRIEPQKIALDFISGLGENQVPFVIVFTKADKLGSTKLAENIGIYKKKLLEEWEELPTMIVTSSEKKIGRDEILDLIEKYNKEYR